MRSKHETQNIIHTLVRPESPEKILTSGIFLKRAIPGFHAFKSARSMILFKRFKVFQKLCFESFKDQRKVLEYFGIYEFV